MSHPFSDSACVGTTPCVLKSFEVTVEKPITFVLTDGTMECERKEHVPNGVSRELMTPMRNRADASVKSTVDTHSFFLILRKLPFVAVGKCCCVTFMCRRKR